MSEERRIVGSGVLRRDAGSDGGYAGTAEVIGFHYDITATIAEDEDGRFFRLRFTVAPRQPGRPAQ